ncbi:DUF2510 domain-containing protein, partial [Streptomyces sp. NPDC060205]|uniref:DUF2510 domain-containing protein n=1 Tax=Streptomyces sp. NPDC060205 TaxID=3347072 RepID=UPI00364BD1D7
MSMTTPPGWYRDPSAPHTERWWDGTAWTEHRRTPGTPQQELHQQQPQQQPYPQSYGPAPTVPMPAADGSGRAKAVALTTAAAGISGMLAGQGLLVLVVTYGTVLT